MNKFIYLPLAIILTFRAAGAEEAPTAKIAPAIEFRETVYDAGESWQGETVSHVFSFTNSGNAELKISRVRSTCGCTASNLSSDTIAPGESGEIRASFNTRGYRGKKSQSIYVSSNDPGQPTVQLRIETTVKTAAAFSPVHLQFGRVTVGAGAVRETALVFDGESFPVLEISAQPEFFSARILEPEGETGGDPPIRIEVALSPEAPVGRHRGTLTARLDHPRIKHLTGHLLVTVEGVITSSPRMLFFSGEDQAEVVVKTVSVTNQGEEPVEIRNVSSSIPQFTAEVKTIEPGQNFEVSIRLSPETEPGRYNGEVRIETSLPDQAVIAVPLRANTVP
jgi:hypothetical protein